MGSTPVPRFLFHGHKWQHKQAHLPPRPVPAHLSNGVSMGVKNPKLCRQLGFLLPRFSFSEKWYQLKISESEHDGIIRQSVQKTKNKN
jgi:hypothetical protein